MALKNRKIRKKHRGTRTNGRGKKGSRRKGGGKGNAGSLRHKKMWFIKNMPGYFGKHGMPGRKEKVRYVTLEWIDQYVRDHGLKEINVAELGYDRVLGRGNLTVPVTIKAKSFTNKAIEKIEAANGKAVNL